MIQEINRFLKKEAELEGVKTIASITDLPSPTTTSISIITPPKVTLGILKEAKALSIPAVWLQPGAEDAGVVEYVREHLSDNVVIGGPCILVNGDGLLRSQLQTRLQVYPRAL
ncbi:hypothetical protein FRB96_007951 [Tulasnella sp. 330]|nr:hypothetical protein FRB96_007951 [Tulasnella sp. 330]